MGRVRSFKLRRGTWINGYQVRERLGRGWEGEVYRVREEYSQGQRVLKLFDPSLYRSRHMHQYGAKLEILTDVAGVVRFYHGGYWEVRDAHYLVMRFVEGVSLERLVAKRSMPLFRALRIVRDLLNIVRDCHARDCRVGDIHADNIILAAGDRPFIIDLDLGTTLTRRTAVEDITAAAQLLYYLNWTRGPYSADLRHVLPKHADALKARYKKASDVLDSLAGLMGA
jgi:serine/threonine protein kinase